MSDPSERPGKRDRGENRAYVIAEQGLQRFLISRDSLCRRPVLRSALVKLALDDLRELDEIAERVRKEG